MQVIGPDEKALVAVGDNWEWTPTKRLLLNVTEASLYYIKRQNVLSKFGAAQLASMPALKCLRFVSTDFSSLKSVSETSCSIAFLLLFYSIITVQLVDVTFSLYFFVLFICRLNLFRSCLVSRLSS